MRDHRRLLGTLFIVWAAVQVAALVVVAALGALPSEPASMTALRWGLTALSAAVYVLLGLKLRRHDPRVRVFAIAFSALALLSLPVGTALGLYGLWVLLRQPEQAPA